MAIMTSILSAENAGDNRDIDKMNAKISQQNNKRCQQIIKDTEGLEDIKAIEAFEAMGGNSLKYKMLIEDIQKTIKKGKTYAKLLKEKQKREKDCYIDLEHPTLKYINSISLRDFLLLLETLKELDIENLPEKQGVSTMMKLGAIRFDTADFSRAMRERQNYRTLGKDKRYYPSDYEGILDYSGIKRGKILQKYQSVLQRKSSKELFGLAYDDAITNAKLIKQRRDEADKIGEEKKKKEEERAKKKEKVIDRNKIKIICKYDDSKQWFFTDYGYYTPEAYDQDRYYKKIFEDIDITIYKCDKCKAGYEAEAEYLRKELTPERRKKEYGIDKRYIDMIYNAGIEAKEQEHNKILKEILESGECKIILSEEKEQ